MVNRAVSAGVLTIVALWSAGCAATESEPTTTTSGAAQPSAETESAEPTSAPTDVIDIAIANGSVQPVNAQRTATVGVPITLRVTSDAADELHVHAVPEHTFEVRPAADQSFEFTVEVPGRVEVELHRLGRTVVTINVHP